MTICAPSLVPPLIGGESDEEVATLLALASLMKMHAQIRVGDCPVCGFGVDGGTCISERVCGLLGAESDRFCFDVLVFSCLTDFAFAARQGVPFS